LELGGRQERLVLKFKEIFRHSIPSGGSKANGNRWKI